MRGLGAFVGRMQWNWVYEMVVIISGLDDGQWYQGTEPCGYRFPLNCRDLHHPRN